MAWNRAHITSVARSSAAADHNAFEAIGLDAMEDARVLDIGCFDGYNTRLKFAPYQNIAQVVAIDPDTDALQDAQRTCKDDRFQWIPCNLQDFPWDGTPFDVVYMGHVFQHLPRKEQALEKIREMLAPGGYVVIKTVDDSMKTSYPDPDRLMEQVFALYEESVRPYRPHTAHTDRNNGGKCYSLLAQAGFGDVSVRIFHSDTAGKTAQERQDLFDRMNYFRRTVPPDAPRAAQAQAAMDDLMERWRQQFLKSDYYFDSPTVMAIGRKPGGAKAETATPADASQQVGPWTIRPMAESDLGDVMAIETAAFPSPWTPLAYAMELRHNPQASYVVARNEEGALGGYIGWWYGPEAATIAHVAVSDAFRRQGLGRILVDCACEEAAAAGKTMMQLQVRRANDGARAFYGILGFQEVAISDNYYTNPDDDAVIMVRPLQP